MRSRLVPHERTVQIRESLLIPPRRGGVNWMTDFAQNSQGAGDRERPIATIYDAWLDLRGRAATEDLILGDRSVAGFPILSSGGALAGFFFISHPLRGLFFDGAPGKPLAKLLAVVREIRNFFGSTLATAIDLDMLARFARRARPLQQFNHQEGDYSSSYAKRVPLIDLSEESPSGYMAAIRLEPAEGGRFTVESSINEGVFTREMWSRLGLLSFFPQDWQTDIVGHMQSLAHASQSDPDTIEWKEQHTTAPPKESVSEYYPVGSRTPATHREHLSSNRVTDTELHEQIARYLGLYSSPPTSAGSLPQADLVLPIVDRTSTPGAGSVNAVLRFNCDRPEGNDVRSHRALYELASRFQPRLGNDMGGLLQSVDEDVRGILAKQGNENEVADRYKQLVDAAWLFAGRCASRLVRAQAKTEGDDSWEIVGYAFEYVWSRLYNSVDQVSKRKTQFEAAKIATEEFAAQLEAIKGLPLSLVTFWLRIWMPVMNQVEGDYHAFANLVLRDPGLVEVLRHLVISRAWDGFKVRDLLRETSPVGSITFGYPSHDARLESLQVGRLDSKTMKIEWEDDSGKHAVELRWSVKPKDGPAEAPYTPAGIAIRTGRVSQRVARTIDAKEVAFSEMPSRLRHDVPILQHIPPSELLFRQEIEHVERTLLGFENCANHWTVLPLLRADADTEVNSFLWLLGPADRGRAIVQASRDMTLSNALSRWRAERLESERAALASRATIWHGYRGPLKQISTAASHLESSLGELAPQFSGILNRMHDKAVAAGNLADAAIVFCKARYSVPPPDDVTGGDLIEDIDDAKRAHDQVIVPVVKNMINRRALANLQLRCARPVLSHCLARLIENAVNYTESETTIEVTSAVTWDAVTVMIQNKVHDLQGARDRIEGASVGKLSGHHGVLEAIEAAKMIGATLKYGFVVPDLVVVTLKLAIK